MEKTTTTGITHRAIKIQNANDKRGYLFVHNNANMEKTIAAMIRKGAPNATAKAPHVSNSKKFMAY